MSKKAEVRRAGIEEILEELKCGPMPPQANYLLADVNMYNLWKDFSNREIRLFDEIDDGTMRYADQLYRWDREDDLAGIKPEDRQPVVMYIQNFGGDLTTCYALIAAMKAYKGKIITVNQGVACSAAALIFICGTRGYRYCTKYSFTLIHQGSSSGGYGTYSQQESSQKNYRRMIDMMEEIVLQNTDIDSKTYKRICNHENYYYADDCIKYGICDKIIENISDIYEGFPDKKGKKVSKSDKKVTVKKNAKKDNAKSAKR